AERRIGWFQVIIAVLLLMVHLAAAQVQIKYFKTGDSLVLRPSVSSAITSITWKHEGYIAAEWIKDAVDLEYLGDLKGRLDLNLETGVLTVRNMTPADQGVFNVEMNNKVLPDAFKAQWIQNLDDHHVEVTATCGFRCGEEFNGAGPVQYFWKKGEAGPWEEGERMIAVENTEETRRFRTFTCKAVNPVSEKESKPVFISLIHRNT
uniref:Ig-like domain-containing protein n=1 Tax=Cyprinodon variegatus TaxID=28743 RepID=A0A3Q2DWV0_CYPVA